MEQNDVGSEILLSLPFLFRGKRIAFKIVSIENRFSIDLNFHFFYERNRRILK